eukprot:5977491-Pleurochrysis_carterae.AAC.1
MSAERDARHKAHARVAGASALVFETPAVLGASGATRAAGGKRRDDQAGLGTLGDGRGEEGGGAESLAFAGLRPHGAEEGTAQAVLAALEEAMRAAGKLHAALAEALGTPPALAALTAAGSEAAAESAVANWRELLERVWGGRAGWAGRVRRYGGRQRRREWCRCCAG